MSDVETIAENIGRVPRPTLAQVRAIVNYIEEHPDLSHRSMRIGMGHAKFKKMWVEMSNIVNTLNGAVKTTKGWIKYWADKRRSILMKKKQIEEGKIQCLLTPLEQKILDLCGDKCLRPRKRKKVKEEPCNGDDEDLYDEVFLKSDECSQLNTKLFPSEAEERQFNIMDKLVEVMDQQASAMSRMAQASLDQSKAMERIAEASNTQALAVDRLAGTFEAISASVLDVRNAILGIDYTMKRCFPVTTTRQNSSIFN